MKQDRSGGVYYLHKLVEDPNDTHPRANAHKGRKCADAEFRDQVYRAFLGGELILSEFDANSLHKRGLTDEQIKFYGYRSLFLPGRAKIAQKLYERFDDKLFTVPGFIVKEKDGETYPAFTGAPGIVIPVRDNEGQIIALKVRRRHKDKGPKYSYMSSKGKGGPGPGSPVHIPKGVKGPIKMARLAEAELAADVCTALNDIPTISASGVNNYKAAIPALKELEVEVVRLAFDADSLTNPVVARALRNCFAALTEPGFVVELERWNPADSKGDVGQIGAVSLDSDWIKGRACPTAAGRKQRVPFVVTCPRRRPGHKPLDQFPPVVALVRVPGGVRRVA